MNTHVPQTKIRRRGVQRGQRTIPEELLDTPPFEDAVRAGQGQCDARDP